MICGLIRVPRARPRRTPPYTFRRSLVLRRRAEPRAPAPPRVNNGSMLFDRPASLPVATMRSKSKRAALASHLRGIRITSWRWARPRLVPATVAIVGMLAVLGSAEYLTRLARHTPEQPAVVQHEPQLASMPMTVDAPLVGTVMQLPVNGAPLRIRLVPYR